MLAKLLIFFLMFPALSTSQQIIFCENVDAGGHATNASDRFNISRTGSNLKLLVTAKKALTTKSVVFDIYSIRDGKEMYENTIRMDIRPFSTWFYKEIVFYREGDFIVYVYDDTDQMLAVGKMKLTYKD